MSANPNPERDPLFRGLVLLMCIALVVALAFDGVTHARGATATVTKTSTTSPAQRGASSQTIPVTLSEFSIKPAAIAVRSGTPFVLHVQNDGTAQHAFTMDAPGRTLTTPMIDAGSMYMLQVPALATGAYKAWCPVPGHENLGMQATVLASTSPSSSATAMAGMTTATTSSGSMDNMSAAQMAAMHKASMTAFPAVTPGVGNQPLRAQIVDGVKVFHLTASAFTWTTAPGQTAQAFGYKGQVPGPQIRVHQGDRIKVILTNNLPQPTTIHWHGVTVPNAMDGVPYITQDPVMPGGTFTYQFKVVDPPGTYLYHSHFNSTEQVGKGLYGAFVIEPKTKPKWDVEYTEILNDGPLGYTIDGKQWPATAPLVAKRGQWVRMRLANMGEMLHPLHQHGYHFEVVAHDGAPVRQPYEADTLVIAPGETYDVMVHAIYPGVWALHCHILAHVEGPQGMFGMATALIVK